MSTPRTGARDPWKTPARAATRRRRGERYSIGRRWGLVLAVALLLIAPAALGRKFSYMTPQGQWRTISEAAYKPRRAGAPLLINANGMTIHVDFQDADGEGFNDPAKGTARRNVVQAVLTLIAGLLDYPGGVLDVVFEASAFDDFGYLAWGGTYFPAPAAPAGFYNGFAFQHLNSHADPSASLADLYCSVNFGYPIYAGTGSPAYNEYDLASLLLHEFSHGLGIISLADQNGNSTISYGNPGIFAVWDRLLVMGGSFTDLWADDGTFVGNPSSLVGNSPGVYFNGTRTIQVFGRRPRVYTPDYFELDSSLSHWIQGVAAGAVMEPMLDKGDTRRTLAPLDKAALEDLGWKMWSPPVDAARRGWELYR